MAEVVQLVRVWSEHIWCSIKTMCKGKRSLELVMCPNRIYAFILLTFEVFNFKEILTAYGTISSVTPTSSDHRSLLSCKLQDPIPS